MRGHRKQFWHRRQQTHLQGLQVYGITRQNIIGSPCSQGTSCGLDASEQGQWSSQSSGSSCTIAFSWCFSTSTRPCLNCCTHFALRQALIANCSPASTQSADSKLLSVFFKARTYTDTQHRPHRRPIPIYSSIPFHSKRRAWSEDYENAGTIRLIGLRCIYTNSRLPSYYRHLQTEDGDVSISAELSLWRSLSSSEQTPQQSRAVQKAYNCHRCWSSPFVNSCVTSGSSTSAPSLCRTLWRVAWLHVPPITAVGLGLTVEMIRMSVCTRLGARTCEPDTCPCGKAVDARDLHGLSCQKSAVRHQRHWHQNDIIWRSVKRAQVPAVKEQITLSRDDGKRPDGATLISFARGISQSSTSSFNRIMVILSVWRKQRPVMHLL